MNKVKNITLSLAAVRIFAWLWLAVPMLLFLWGWLRPVVGWPLMAAVAYVLAVCVRREAASTERIEIGRRYAVCMCIVALMVVFSGIGGFSYQQMWDNSFRNALFYELVNDPWPVVNCDEAAPRMLCYYIGFWLPAAVLAKVTSSFLVGNVVLLLYAMSGIMAVLTLIYRHIGRVSVTVTVLFFLYCGWDAVIFLLLGTPSQDGMWHLVTCMKDMTETNFSAPTVPIHLCYIYNQGVALWVALALMYDGRMRRGELLLAFSFLMLQSPFACIGLAPVLGWSLARHWRQSLSAANAVGFVLCLVLACYYVANDSGGTLRFVPGGWLMPLLGVRISVARYFCSMAVFVVFSYGVFMPFVWRRVKGDRLFWGLFVCSLLPTLVAVGMGQDLAARASMPFVCYFMYNVLAEASSMRWRTVRGRIFALCLVVGMLGSPTWFNNLCGVRRHFLYGTPLRADWLQGRLFDRDSNNVCYGNFVADDYGDSFFARCLMRRNEEGNE